MKHISIVTAALTTVLSFSACQEEDFGFTSKDINYAAEFAKTFGEPDANQDWSTISTRAVNVTLPEQGEYTVYITNHRLDYTGSDILLFAQMENMTGNGEAQSIRFDYPKGYKRAFVTILQQDGNRIATREVTFGEGESDVEFTGAMLYSAPTSLPVLKKASYIVAFEDLGGICDWDFNDAVFSISHPTGSETMTIELKAVGGTLPVKLQMNGNDIIFGNASEVHEAFGVDQDMRVNVSIPDPDLADKSDEKPALAASLTVDANATMGQLLSQLTLSVEQPDGTQSTIAAPCDYSDKTTVPSNTPQAILIAKADWAWPAEGEHIDAAYEDFTTWVKNANLGNTWYGSAWYEDDLGEDEIPEGDEEDTPTVAQAKRR